MTFVEDLQRNIRVCFSKSVIFYRPSLAMNMRLITTKVKNLIGEDEIFNLNWLHILLWYIRQFNYGHLILQLCQQMFSESCPICSTAWAIWESNYYLWRGNLLTSLTKYAWISYVLYIKILLRKSFKVTWITRVTYCNGSGQPASLVHSPSCVNIFFSRTTGPILAKFGM